MSFIAITQVTTRDLSQEQQAFLRLLAANADKDPEAVKYALYMKLAKDKFAYVSDALIVGDEADDMLRDNNNAGFGFYGGAARARILTQNGTLVVSDDRFRFFKPIPSGRARPEDRGDLMATLRRELLAEVWCFALDRSRVYVPHGIIGKHICSGLDIQCRESQEIGELKPISHFVNEKRRQLELIGVWDVRNLAPGHSFHYDDSPSQEGGRWGIPVLVLDQYQEVIGFYSGLQGFVRFMDYRPHDVLTDEEIERAFQEFLEKEKVS